MNDHLDAEKCMTKSLHLKMGKIFEQAFFTKGVTQMANKDIKIYSASLVTKETQIKTTIKYR